MSGSGGEQQAFFERYAPPDLRAESAEVGASKSGEEIRACADAILSDYDDAPVRSFVLTLAERRIRDCLREPECAVLA